MLRLVRRAAAQRAGVGLNLTFLNLVPYVRRLLRLVSLLASFFAVLSTVKRLRRVFIRVAHVRQLGVLKCGTIWIIHDGHFVWNKRNTMGDERNEKIILEATIPPSVTVDSLSVTAHGSFLSIRSCNQRSGCPTDRSILPLLYQVRNGVATFAVPQVQ